MTKPQRQIMIHMKSSENTFAIKHMKGSRSVFRILTEDRTPLFNAGSRSFKLLIDKGMIEADKSEVPTRYRLTEAGVKYKLRIRNERTADTV